MTTRNETAEPESDERRPAAAAAEAAFGTRTVDAATGGAIEMSPQEIASRAANAETIVPRTLEIAPHAVASDSVASDVAPVGTDAATPTPGSAALDAEVLLVYDAQCPACDNYCRMVRIREDVGRLVIVDAREDSAVMREITAAGLDIDEGMVLKLGDALYYGADAIHMLALIGGDSGWFNRLNYRLFRSRRLARRLYPVLKAGRAVLLKLLGRTRINNLGIEGNERF